MITIIDYGAGNIKSIQNMLKRVGVQSIITNDPNQIAKAEKLILPGVGHFDYGMRNLKSSGLIQVLEQKVLIEKTPILGICLGAQLLGKRSEEGIEKGLAWIDMEVVRFDSNRMEKSLKIPNMGWNYIQPAKKNQLFREMDDQTRFYFVHSYHMKPQRPEDVLTYSTYGYKFASAVSFENIYGVQFHPEKSHIFGIKMFTNFVSRI
ncbi:imidazole glycerol phosphate synthase subunit HisH [bacterium]|nr:imidazole glycerol phosphate synthase subunit HisH [bacterium]